MVLELGYIGFINNVIESGREERLSPGAWPLMIHPRRGSSRDQSGRPGDQILGFLGSLSWPASLALFPALKGYSVGGSALLRL